MSYTIHILYFLVNYSVFSLFLILKLNEGSQHEELLIFL